MVNKKILSIIFCVILNMNYSQSFDYEILTSKRYIDKDTITIDTFSINPRTFQAIISNKKIDSLAYKLLPLRGKVMFFGNRNDSVIFKYHPLLIDFNKKHFMHPISLNRSFKDKQYYQSGR